MVIDVWGLQAIDALDDELAFRIPAANVAESPLCAVGICKPGAISVLGSSAQGRTTMISGTEAAVAFESLLDRL